MRRADRQDRLTRAKLLGRKAYAHVRWSDVEGVIPVDGQDKHLRTFEDDGLSIQLLSPFRSYAQPHEFSRLQIRAAGCKVLEVRWSKAGDFRVVTFEEGDDDWQKTLLAWPDPIPFE